MACHLRKFATDHGENCARCIRYRSFFLLSLYIVLKSKDGVPPDPDIGDFDHPSNQ